MKTVRTPTDLTDLADFSAKSARSVGILSDYRRSRLVRRFSARSVRIGGNSYIPRRFIVEVGEVGENPHRFLTFSTDLADFRRDRGVREIGEIGEIGGYSKSPVYMIRIS